MHPGAPLLQVGAKSARQLLQEEETERLGRISTECAQLDAILGGGIPPCQLTEICKLLLSLHLLFFR